MQIANHKVAAIDCILKDDDGQIVDSTEGGAPLAYLHGVGAIIPGLGTALDGKAAGDRLEVTVPPAAGGPVAALPAVTTPSDFRWSRSQSTSDTDRCTKFPAPQFVHPARIVTRQAT